MRKVVFLTVAAIIGAASSAYGQGSDLQQKLKDQFILTKVTTDGSNITSPGTVVTLRKGGLWTYSTASPVPYLNTYNEKGKLSQPFMANLGAGVAGGLRSNNTQFPQHLFMAGARVSIIALFFKNDGFTFRLYSDPYDGIHYYGDLKFPFKKGSAPAPDEALARISEVLVVSGAPPTEVADKGDTLTKTPPPVSPPPAPLHLPATYVSAQTASDQLQLNADHTLSMQEAGQTYHGTFEANGTTLDLSIEPDIKTTATIAGTKLTDASGQTWVLKEQSTAPIVTEGTLRNEDVIKMTKASFDDAFIIAKISSSKCQFDTSTDTLIRLKQSGVSAAVLKAMVGAGK